MDTNLSVDDIFTNLAIPVEVRKVYQSKGVKSLYEWQRECLYSTNVLKGDNLVYCAPTSGGKTLVAELVIFKTILTLKKQALFVLPYVSLVVEKERYFKSMIKIFNRTQPAGQRLSVQGFFGDHVQKKKSYRESILICTIEKANGILNSLIQRGKCEQLGCVVLDEMHVLGNKFNGFLLEILISKLQYCSLQSSQRAPETIIPSPQLIVNRNGKSKGPVLPVDMRASSFKTIQIIAMSATMGNVQEIATWLRGQLYMTNYRPVPLTEYVKAGNAIMNKAGETIRTLHNNHVVNDPDHVVTLSVEAIDKGQQVMIFCSSKLLCSQTCSIIAKNLPLNANITDKLKAQRQDLLTNLQDLNGMMFSASQDMSQCILLGIAYHHAGLTSPERHAIESAYKSGIIVILCATSTLAAGVNLPAGCVLIRSLNIGREVLDVVQYRQMSGRAGRAGQSTSGESYLLVKAIESPKALHIANSVMPDVTSQLHPGKDGGNGLLKAAIEVIGLCLVTTVGEYVMFVQQTLLYSEAINKNEAMETAMMSLKFLIDARIVDCSVSVNQLSDTAALKLSRFGTAMLKSNLHPDEAIVIYESLSRALDGLNSDCNLHLLYLVTPLDHAIVPDFKRLLGMYEHSIKHCSDNGKSALGSNKYPVIANVFESIGIDLGVLHKWQFKAPSINEIGMCNQAVKLYSLFTSGNTTTEENSKVSKPNLIGFKSGSISKYDWKVLSYCKRISAALVLQSLMEGRAPQLIAKETGLQVGDIEALLRNSRIITGKVIKFCVEMGWSFLSKMISSFQSQIDGEVPKELKSLLSIPMMTKKIANVLLLHNICTVEQFVKCSVTTLAKYLHLSIGFELQDLQAIEVELDASDSVGLTEPSQASNGQPQPQGYSTKQTRDEHTQVTLLSLITKLMSNANEMLAKTSENIEDTANTYLKILNTTDSDPLPKTPQRPTTSSSTNSNSHSTSYTVLSSDDELSSSDEEETKSSDGSDDEGDEPVDPEAEETDRLHLLSGLQYVMKNDKENKKTNGKDSSIKVNIQIVDKSSVAPVSAAKKVSLTPSLLLNAESVSDLVPVAVRNDDFYSLAGSESPVNVPVVSNIVASPMYGKPIVVAQQSPLPSIPPVRRGSPSLFSELLTRSGSPSSKPVSQSSNASREMPPLTVNEVTIRTSTPTQDGVTATTTTLTLSDEELMEMMEDLENNGLLIACEDKAKPSESKTSKPSFVRASEYNNFVYYPREENSNGLSNTGQTSVLPETSVVLPYTPHVLRTRDRTSGFGLTPISPANNGFMYTCPTKTTGKPTVKRSINASSNKKNGSNSSNRNLLYAGMSSVHFSVTKKVSPSSQLNVNYQSSAQHIQSACEEVLLLSKRERNEEVSSTYFSRVQTNMDTPAANNGKTTSASKPVASLKFNVSSEIPSTATKKDSSHSFMGPDTVITTARKSRVSFDHTKVTTGVSPFSTPFTSSKVKTPGKYLYYPLFDSLTTNTTSSSKVAEGSTIVGSGFGIRQVNNPQHCISFIEKLTNCSRVSFELIFKELPPSVLSKHPIYYNKNSKIEPTDQWESHSHTWWPLISSAFNKHTSVSSVSDDNPSLEACIRMSKEPPSRGDVPHVLVGISLCFDLQDEFSYYLPLPTSLPLTSDKSLAIGGENGSKNVMQRSMISLTTLPLSCHKLICKFVGFPRVLNKCTYLKSFMSTMPASRVYGLNKIHNSEEEPSNSLFLVDSHWCHVARSTLLDEWRKGGCIEWQVVNELMSNNKISKIAIDMKNKLVVLRERDVIVNGPLSDPLIAKQLLDQCTEEDTIVDMDIPIVDTHTAISQEDKPKIKENTVKIGCFLAISILRVMARFESLLTKNGLLDLYNNIEMPLMYSVSDAEFCGILIDAAFFGNLRQTVKDRLSVIEYYFNCIHDDSNGEQGHPMNLESHIDVNIWKERVIAGFIARLKCSLEKSDTDAMDVEGTNALQTVSSDWIKLIQSTGLSIDELVSKIVESKHPLFQLTSEHRSLTKLIPVCSGTLKYRSFNRVKALYNTLGTATGRIMLSNPPLQMVPHECDYIPAPRMSLHEELSLCNPTARLLLISQFNSAVVSEDAIEWVRVKSLTPRAESGDIFAEYSNGKLHKILDKTIGEPFYMNYNPADASTQIMGIAMRNKNSKMKDSLSDGSLMQLWQKSGYQYSTEDAVNILQVIVQFTHTAGNVVKHTYYTYPADKVYRVQSSSVPPPKELELIASSIQSDWIENEIYTHCNPQAVNSSAQLIASVSALYDCIQVRDGFIASEGYTFIGADYCQIELRILAHYCKDESLCQAIRESPDVFKSIAARWKHKQFKEVATEERNTVKQMCYALIYGAGPSLVAEHAHITVEAAQNMMEDFLKIFPGISLFISSVKKKCRRVGYVETLFGRRRVLNDVNSKKKAQRGRADRQAVNMLCQGTAADLIKLVMINIHSRLKELSVQSIQQRELNSNGIASYGVVTEEPLFLFRKSRHLPGGGLYKAFDDVRPVLQIHDELLFEVRVSDIHKVAAVIKDCMENAVVLNVPLEVKLSVGSSWGSLESYHLLDMDNSSTLSKAPPLVRDLFGKDDE